MKRILPSFSAQKERTFMTTPTLLAGGCLLLLGLVMYLFRLQPLIGAGGGEAQTIATLSTLHGLAGNPLLLPYKLAAFVLLRLPFDNLLMVRAAAAGLALLAVGLFFVLAKRWYGLVGGFLGGLLFTISGWLLHTGRYGAGYIALVVMVLGLLSLTVWINSTNRSGLALATMAAGYGLALYVPGGLWFVLASAVVCRRGIAEHLSRSRLGAYLAAGFLALLSAGGLALALARDSSLWHQWLAIPPVWPDMATLGKQAALSLSAFVLRGPGTPETWLAHTPILDVASSCLLLLGVLFYGRHRNNSRTVLLSLFLIIGILLTALNGAPALGMLVPTVYLIMVGGLAWLFYQWKKVFPRNPIAEVTALTLLGVLVVCTMAFHAERYFTAWRLSPDTVRTYRQAQPASGSKHLPYLIQ
jgi:hypothetical protein